MSKVAGKDGELQRSAGDRWARTGEGEGGMIGVATTTIRDASTGEALRIEGEIVQDYNCAGMVRAWVDEKGQHRWAIWDEIH